MRSVSVPVTGDDAFAEAPLGAFGPRDSAAGSTVDHPGDPALQAPGPDESFTEPKLGGHFMPGGQLEHGAAADGGAAELASRAPTTLDTSFKGPKDPNDDVGSVPPLNLFPWLSQPPYGGGTPTQPPIPTPTPAPITATADLNAGTVTFAGGPEDAGRVAHVTYKTDNDVADVVIDETIAIGELPPAVLQHLVPQIDAGANVSASAAGNVLTVTAVGGATLEKLEVAFT